MILTTLLKRRIVSKHARVISCGALIPDKRENSCTSLLFHHLKTNNTPITNFNLNEHQQYRYLTTGSIVKNTRNNRRADAKLEEHIHSYVNNNLKDPILNISFQELKWLRGPSIRRNSSSDAHDDEKKEKMSLSLSLHLPSPRLYPDLDLLKSKLTSCVQEAIASYTKDEEQKYYEIEISIQRSPTNQKEDQALWEEKKEKLGKGLENVSNFLAVYSCKGGVGKSTISVNLAYALASRGMKVGLLDTDIYGPSLPQLVKPTCSKIKKSRLGDGMILPIEYEGVKLLSIGHVSPKSGVPNASGGSSGGAAVMRGPMASRVVTQLLKGTEWGELDVLILDMPPGTGDVHLSLMQELINFNGVVSVSTPSKLSVIDCQKGIEMLDSLGVPTLAIVENMAYFECGGGETDSPHKHYPFGKGIDVSDLFSNDKGASNSNKRKIPAVYKLPISEEINEANDKSMPLTLMPPKENKTDITNVYSQLSKHVQSELYQQMYGLNNEASLKFEIDGETFSSLILSTTTKKEEDAFCVRLFSDTNAIEMFISAQELRLTHPKTGEILVDFDDVNKHTPLTKSADSMVEHHRHDHHHHHHESNKSSNKEKEIINHRRLFPVQLERHGNYGYSINWADGATIIYSLDSIVKAASRQ